MNKVEIRELWSVPTGIGEYGDFTYPDERTWSKYESRPGRMEFRCDFCGSYLWPVRVTAVHAHSDGTSGEHEHIICPDCLEGDRGSVELERLASEKEEEAAFLRAAANDLRAAAKPTSEDARAATAKGEQEFLAAVRDVCGANQHPRGLVYGEDSCRCEEHRRRGTDGHV